MKKQTIHKTIIQGRKTFVTTLLLMACALQSKAQLNPFQNMYFQNRYLYNPAMAGLDKGLNLNIAYRQQWSNFPGTPKTGSLTADFQPVDKVGLGINVNNDQAGLIRSTRVMGTYAYHLPLNGQSEHLSFGISLGINDSGVDYSKINGDVTDGEIDAYNKLKPYVDADFGVAYTNDRLSVNAVLPNMKSTFFKSSDERFDVDRLLFIGVASYKFLLSSDGDGYILEPLAAYRMVKGYKDILDAGLNFTMNNYGLYFQGIYHTNQSLGLGVGLDQRTYAFNFNYNLETGPITHYTSGAFELGIKLRLTKSAVK